MIAATLIPGELFAGRYRILSCLAAGGMGAVYEVLHVETERRRALKVMLPELVRSEDLRDRFKREARVTANVQSEHIVEVFDAGVDETTGIPFLVMELLTGEELGDLLERAGPLCPADVVTYLRQVALALDKTHAARIVHRDLKPENLFLTHRDDGSPHIKILDFGISKVVSEANTRANATQSLGTPLYMAPEQIVGARVQPATDLYALGLIAYTLLAGRPYWHEESVGTDNVFAFAQHTTRGPTEAPTVRAARVGKQLPRAFDAWFFRVAHPDPAQRFASATETIDALAGVFALSEQTATRPAIASEAEVRTIPAGPLTVQAATVLTPPTALMDGVGPPSLTTDAQAAGTVAMAPRAPLSSGHGSGSFGPTVAMTDAGAVLDARAPRPGRGRVVVAGVAMAGVLLAVLAGTYFLVWTPGRSAAQPSADLVVAQPSADPGVVAVPPASSAEPVVAAPEADSATAVSTDSLPVAATGKVRQPARRDTRTPASPTTAPVATNPPPRPSATTTARRHTRD